jgi:hypothetical protein
MRHASLSVLCGLLLVASPLAAPVEVDGALAVEAEDFARQTSTGKRAWRLTRRGATPDVTPDGDPPHLDGASGGAYVELLPDTRRTHADPLVRGESFSDEPGEAVLTYPIRFKEPGRYYVWARAYSTGTEDNSVHVGLDGAWPESGRRMQWCDGKDGWRWESRQRTKEQHCGVPGAIYLDVRTPGLHTVQFSMREDGFELDRFVLTTSREFVPPAPTQSRGRP